MGTVDKLKEMGENGAEMDDMAADQQLEGPVIGRNEVREAQRRLKEYKAGKAALDQRIIASEQWWRMKNWEEINAANGHQVGGARPNKPVSGWLWNCVANKHADLMDAMPEIVILPRARDDEETARALNTVLPVILDQNNFEQVYADTGWQFVKEGTGVTAVLWDSGKLNGLGDIAIERCNVLNLFWEPGVDNIQESPDFFSVRLENNKQLEEMYPFLRGRLHAHTVGVNEYRRTENETREEKSEVVDWYYKRRNAHGRQVLHLCKFVGDEILYSSENDPRLRERGWYDDGQYPFVFDAMYPVEGGPCGHGVIDIGRSLQELLDEMSNAMADNTVLSATPRYFMSSASEVSDEDLMNVGGKRIIKVAGNLENAILPMQSPQLPANCLAFYESKVQELKQITGNSDLSAGVETARTMQGTAMMLEAGGKLSRDMNKSRYRAFKQMIGMVIERIRQFYDIPRQYRIAGEDGHVTYMAFSNHQMRPQPLIGPGGLLLGDRTPAFDVMIEAEKDNPYTRETQNANAMSLMQMGCFDPERVDQTLMMLDMMDFKGRYELIDKVRAMGTMQERMARWQQLALTLAQRYEPGMTEQIAQAMMAAPLRHDLPLKKGGAAVPAQTLAQRAATQAVEATQPR